MYFQTLETKKECIGLYCDDKLLFGELLSLRQGGRTWGYSSFLKGVENIEYAKIMCNGKSLSEVCPPAHKQELNEVLSLLEAQNRAFKETQINLKEVCLFNLIPKHILERHCKIKNIVTKHVFENYKKPENYTFLIELLELNDQISQQKINIETNNLWKLLENAKEKKKYRKLLNVEPHVDYNIFGTITGRLINKKGTFPILTLDRSLRKLILPQNDCFVELDYNGADLRSCMALSDVQLPKSDVYEALATNFGFKATRSEIKLNFLSWLNSSKENKFYDSIVSKEILKEKYWDSDTNIVKNAFGREIHDVDEHHALSYIIQSTTNDVVLERAIAINKFLAFHKFKSFIAFVIHDSIVFDVVKEEKSIFRKIINMFESTKIGAFVTNLSIGQNFGEMNRT